MMKTKEFIRRVTFRQKQILLIDFTRSAFADYNESNFDDPTEDYIRRGVDKTRGSHC